MVYGVTIQTLDRLGGNGITMVFVDAPDSGDGAVRTRAAWRGHRLAPMRCRRRPSHRVPRVRLQRRRDAGYHNAEWPGLCERPVRRSVSPVGSPGAGVRRPCEGVSRAAGRARSATLRVSRGTPSRRAGHELEPPERHPTVVDADADTLGRKCELAVDERVHRRVDRSIGKEDGDLAVATANTGTTRGPASP